MKLRPAVQVSAFLLAAIVCAAISNVFAGSERRLAWIRRGQPVLKASPSARPVPVSPSVEAKASSQAKSFPPHPDRPYLEISGEDASQLFARGVPFFDARRSSVYREGHIAGARSFPVWEADVEDRVRALVGEGLDPSAPIVAYCSGGECEDSHMLAQKLYLVGFDDALVYKDGFPDWEKRGLPIRKGDKP